MTKRKKSVVLALVIVFCILLFGTIFYHYVENWGWVDALYFTVITLTTIGYGDLYPTHDVSKILTSFFAVVSIPLLFFAFTLIAENYFEKRLQYYLARESQKEIKEIKGFESEKKEK